MYLCRLWDWKEWKRKEKNLREQLFYMNAFRLVVRDNILCSSSCFLTLSFKLLIIVWENGLCWAYLSWSRERARWCQMTHCPFVYWKKSKQNMLNECKRMIYATVLLTTIWIDVCGMRIESFFDFIVAFYFENKISQKTNLFLSDKFFNPECVFLCTLSGKIDLSVNKKKSKQTKMTRNRLKKLIPKKIRIKLKNFLFDKNSIWALKWEQNRVKIWRYVKNVCQWPFAVSEFSVPLYLSCISVWLKQNERNIETIKWVECRRFHFNQIVVVVNGIDRQSERSTCFGRRQKKSMNATARQNNWTSTEKIKEKQSEIKQQRNMTKSKFNQQQNSNCFPVQQTVEST